MVQSERKLKQFVAVEIIENYILDVCNKSKGDYVTLRFRDMVTKFVTKIKQFGISEALLREMWKRYWNNRLRQIVDWQKHRGVIIARRDICTEVEQLRQLRIILDTVFKPLE